MSNHPNRSKSNRSTSSKPTPAEIRTLRESHGLTAEQAGALVHANAQQWERWERGEKPMHPAIFELATIKAAP